MRHDPARYSDRRELRLDTLLVVSDRRDSADAPVSQWMKSPVWTRRAYQNHFKVFPRHGLGHALPPPIPHPCGRTSFRVWTSETMFDNTPMDWAGEYRQHVTGRDFWDEMLVSLTGGVLGTSDLLLHVRDLALADPEMAYAVANINGRANPRTPRMAYVGLTNKDTVAVNTGRHTRDHVHDRLVGHLTFSIEAGSYTLAGCQPLGRGVPGVAGGSVPASAVPSFKHCVPRLETKELPLRSEIVEKWMSELHFREDWRAFVESHNLVCNKGGQPHRAGGVRRPAEQSVEDLQREHGAESLASPEGTPGTLAALKELFPEDLKHLQTQGANHHLYLTRGGVLYLANPMPTELVLDCQEPLFQLKGHWCNEEAGSQAVMAKANGNWVEYKLTPATLVQVRCIGEPAVALPEGTVTTEAALQALERAGHVRVKLLNHVSERVGETSNYKVEVAKVCAMGLEPGPAATHMDATWDKLALHVPVLQLSGQGGQGVHGVCRLVHHLQYMPRGKELQPYYPCIHLKTNAKLGPHQVVRLTVAAPPAVAPGGG